ncbi:MAG: 1-deoxy-D-xylulose 5-phosphate reductoisomerase [Desulfotomaculum sp. 46_296]|nr:MAG: 1-deoxy-D-xylulose 5-phosphate reductoisomerase [Desulfotomaculum sp. 46_296]HAU31793.1 1-deoxy-D-xylulose-5-phosphate reductoisomerase [Desulfotomaculum sp.]
MKKISIIGSTGSIGRQALSVIRQFPSEFRVVGLAAGSNWSVMLDQIREFHPEIVSMADEKETGELFKNLDKDNLPELCWGEPGLISAAADTQADIVIVAVPGISGLIPTLAAIKAGKDIALANKETLVTAGRLVMEMATRANINILPLDSEHSAIWQCLDGVPKDEIARILLTASGGPFRLGPADLSGVTVEMALNHPNWKMGRKVTIDSATLMNKGLEIIEARWLFDLNYDRIKVLIHPQSIIHSMVEFVDGSTLAQLGTPDMRIPIQYALTYPSRWFNELPRINWDIVGGLTFEGPDLKRFRCLSLAIEACREGGTMPVVLNAANEIAVECFLAEKIGFTRIPEIIDEVMDKHKVREYTDINDIFAADGWARQQAREIVGC